MDRIRKLADGIDVAPLRAALEAHPELWDANSARTAPPESPHHGLSDIWCRFAPTGAGGNIEHFSIWYPAADHLPVRQIARDLLYFTGGTVLGGILITKIPPGVTCKPHRDSAWHAGFYSKFALQIAAAPGQEFHFERQSLVTKPGDLFTFDNSHTHWVTNESDQDRITAVFCIRIEGGAS